MRYHIFLGLVFAGMLHSTATQAAEPLAKWISDKLQLGNPFEVEDEVLPPPPPSSKLNPSGNNPKPLPPITKPPIPPAPEPTFIKPDVVPDAGGSVANCTDQIDGSQDKVAKPRFYHWWQLWYDEHCCAARSLPQHQMYPSENVYYYFRPYRYGEVIQQLGTAQRWTSSQTNVYDNRFLQVIYNDIPEVVPPKPRKPKPKL